jgi:hypothetical protein
MYQSLSLSILYNKPPPVWQHPLITATLIRSEHIDRLASGTIHHSALLLWSHLIAQTAQNQKDIFPLIIQDEMEEFLPKGNGNNDDNDDNDDNDKKNQLSSYVFTNESFVQGSLSKISSMWIDACAITKNHPSLTQQPHCGPFVKRITQRIDSLQRGEFTIVPFTFRHLVPPRNQEEKPAIEDVQIFIVIELIDDVFCNVTICNSFLDGGVKYHSLSAAGSEGSILYKPCITATGVKLSLLNSQAAWFGLYETVFSAKKIFSLEDFYFKFLPTILGQSWDDVLLKSQRRDAEFSRAVLAAKSNVIGKQHKKLQQLEVISEDNTQNTQNTQNTPNTPNCDENSPLSQSFYKTYADSILVPIIGYGTSSQLIHYTTQFLFRRVLGCGDHQAIKLFLAVKLRCLDMCYNDLSFVNILNKSERFHIETCIREVANYTTYCLEEYEHAGNIVSQSLPGNDNKINHNNPQLENFIKFQKAKNSFPTRELFLIYRGISRLKKELKTAKLISFSSEDQASVLLDDGGLSKQSQHALFPFAETFVLARDKEVLLGSDVESIVGFDLLDLPQGVRSYGDIIYVLRKARDIAITLRAQKYRFKNALLLSRSFIFHVFSNIIPVPVSPYSSPDQIMTDVFSQPASFAELLELCTLCHQFVHILYILGLTESSWDKDELARRPHQIEALSNMDPLECQLIAGVVFVILDYVIHKSPSDQRSMVTDVINSGGFGLSIGHWIVATQGLHLHIPNYAILRSKVIEYFTLTKYQQELLNLPSNDVGTELTSLVTTLNSMIGYTPKPGQELNFRNSTLYFKHPELPYIIQTIVMFRAIALNPASTHLFAVAEREPPSRYDNKAEYDFSIALSFSYGSLHATINHRELPLPHDIYLPKYISWASPGQIINNHLLALHKKTASEQTYQPVIISTEDDILHIKNLPTFNNLLTPADSEQLLSYLTVPYLRIPLVTSFFAKEDHCHALKDPQLRDILSAVLFEQGNLVPFHKESLLPLQVPAQDKSLIGSHYGYLLNELIHNPTLIVNNLIQMFNSALELDIGTVQSAATGIILFIIRVLAYVENYLTWLIDLNTNQVRLYSQRSLPGLSITPSQLEELISARKLLEGVTQGACQDKLTFWSSQLFTIVHMRLEQAEYAHQKAEKYVNMARDAIAQHEENEKAQKMNDEDEGGEMVEVQIDTPSAGQGKKSGQGSKKSRSSRHHAKPEKENTIKLIKKKSHAKQTEKFNTHDSESAKMKTYARGQMQRYYTPGMKAAWKKHAKATLPMSRFGDEGVYQFEDNRIRRGIKVVRKRTNIRSLNEDTTIINNKKDGDKNDDKNGTKDDLDLDDEGNSDQGMKLDGGELTDFLQLSCLIHAHLLLLRRNIAELSPEMGCHMVSSIMYLTTHFDCQ